MTIQFYGLAVRQLLFALPVLLLSVMPVSAQTDEQAEEEKPRLLVMNLEAAGGVSEDDALTLTQLVTVETSDLGAFRTVSFKDLQTMVALEGERQAAGCSDTSCLSDLAGAIGARFVLYGRVSQLGSRTILQLNVMDSESAKPLGREATKASDVGELADALPKLVRGVMQPAVALVAPAPASPPPGPSVAAVVPVSERQATTPPPTDDNNDADSNEKQEDLSLLAGDPPTLRQIRSDTKTDGVSAIAGTEATFIVEGTPRQVMTAFWDKKALHEVLPGGQTMEIKREGKDRQKRRWVEVILRDKIILYRTAYTLRLIRDDERMLLTFKEVDGDVRYARGRIELKPAREKGFTQVSYRLIFSVGKFIPSSWSRQALSDQPLKMAEIIRQRVRLAKEKSGSSARRNKGTKKRSRRRSTRR